ncbi:MAG: hypothetical protein ACYDCL_23050 [Myxococcales bacterium]
MRKLALLAGALAAASCADPAQGLSGAGPLDVVAGWSGSPLMTPGVDCMTCHAATASISCLSPPCRASYKPWTIAGTVYGDPAAPADAGVAGVEILVVDSAGKSLTLVSNAAGNFYTQEALTLPLTSLMVQNQTHRMVMNLQDPILPQNPDGTEAIGSCNLCHAPPPAINSPPGRLFVPP